MIHTKELRIRGSEFEGAMYKALEYSAKAWAWGYNKQALIPLYKELHDIDRGLFFFVKEAIEDTDDNPLFFKAMKICHPDIVASKPNPNKRSNYPLGPDYTLVRHYR